MMHGQQNLKLSPCLRFSWNTGLDIRMSKFVHKFTVISVVLNN